MVSSIISVYFKEKNQIFRMAKAQVEQAVATLKRETGFNDVVHIPNEILEIIPYYGGNHRHLNLFIRKCNYVTSQYKGGEAQEIYNMRVITSRLTGRAAALVKARKDVLKWDQLKTLLSQHFGDHRSETCIAMKLETMQIHPNERYIQFSKRIQTTRSNLFAKVYQNYDEALRNCKFASYNNTALNVFLLNLPEHLMRIVRLNRPETLEKALEIVLEEEMFHKYYSARNRYHQPKVHHGGFRSNRPFIPNLPHNFHSGQYNDGRPNQY